ncbi:uncharacterized protein zbbx [Nerophis ophidion]|uniref:uncharacterized protein zbbx n=1 Tax=Nerophis ophidion TaxID=159077 RepID=UPI002AE0735D|nr:uncharacterized protein zbbx [Nerophis ophidion]
MRCSRCLSWTVVPGNHTVMEEIVPGCGDTWARSERQTRGRVLWSLKELPQKREKREKQTPHAPCTRSWAFSSLRGGGSEVDRMTKERLSETCKAADQKKPFCKTTQEEEYTRAPSLRINMNPNEIVGHPSSKSKSLQFSARNPQGLQIESVTLAQQGNVMEDMLQKLKESMKKEKGERGHPGILQWKAGQFGSINSCTPLPNPKKALKQLSAGKVKIRVLKDEPLTAPPHLPLCDTCCCPQPPTQNKMRGPNFGQGDAATDRQMFAGDCRHDKRAAMIKKEQNVQKSFQDSLLGGDYDEEESARSFQEALKQWRQERSVGPEEQSTMWTQTASKSGVATQTGFPPERDHERQGTAWGNSKAPIKVEFHESRLTYMDRLLLKKHRSTPLEACHPPRVCSTALESLNDTLIEAKQASSRRGQDEDFRSYCALLFAVPVSGIGFGPLNPTLHALDDVSFWVINRCSLVQ